MLEGLKCLLIKLFNIIFNQTFEWMIDIMIWVLQLLPETPFIFEPIQWGPFGKAIGYFVPVAKMLEHLAYALVAIAVWYGIQHITRVLKIIR